MNNQRKESAMRKLIGVTTALAVAALGVVGMASPAGAAGSDSPPTYAVTEAGVTLAAGDVFPEGGHINVKITTVDGGERRQDMHFDPNNGQPGGAYIGKAFYPVNLAPGECIKWVQVSFLNEHFGEGGQAPVCKPVVVIEPPIDPPVDPPVEPPFTPDLKKVTASSANTCVADEAGVNTGTLTVKGYLRNPTPYTLTGTVSVEGVEGSQPFTIKKNEPFTSYHVVPAVDGRLVYSITSVDGKPYTHTVTRPYFDTALCKKPVVTIEAAPTAVIVAVCGSADIDLGNPEDDDAYTTRGTASFVIYVNGDFYGAYAVPAGATERVSLTFAEDTGSHNIQVRTGPAFGDALILEGNVTSDCVPPVVVEPPVVIPPVVCEPPLVPGWLDEDGNAQGCVNNGNPSDPPVVTPVTTPEPVKDAPVTPAAPVVAPVAAPSATIPPSASNGSSGLAETGSEVATMLGIAGITLLLGLGAISYARRNKV